MRMILGRDRPSSGVVTVNGKLYADLPAPLHEVGALLEARSVHTGRSAYNYLLALARTHGRIDLHPRLQTILTLTSEGCSRSRFNWSLSKTYSSSSEHLHRAIHGRFLA